MKDLSEDQKNALYESDLGELFSLYFRGPEVEDCFLEYLDARESLATIHEQLIKYYEPKTPEEFVGDLNNVLQLWASSKSEFDEKDETEREFYPYGMSSLYRLFIGQSVSTSPLPVHVFVNAMGASIILEMWSIASSIENFSADEPGDNFEQFLANSSSLYRRLNWLQESFAHFLILRRDEQEVGTTLENESLKQIERTTKAQKAKREQSRWEPRRNVKAAMLKLAKTIRKPGQTDFNLALHLAEPAMEASKKFGDNLHLQAIEQLQKTINKWLKEEVRSNRK